MLMNLKLDGLTEEVINRLVQTGVSSNKTEAIRMAILEYNERHNIMPINQYIEDELAVRKMQELDREIEQGKRKLLSKEEALGKYAKYLE